jgi:sucrose-6-phosphate hydrolase SacC (GH32 family)
MAGTAFTFEPEAKTLTLGETKIPLALQPAEDLELRVFLDKSIIEVFSNDRLAALAPHQYAPGNLGVSLFSEGGSVLVKEVKGWKLRSIYTGTSTFAPANASGRR